MWYAGTSARFAGLRNIAAVPEPQARIPPPNAALRAVSFSPSLVRRGTGKRVCAELVMGTTRTAASVKSPANDERHGRAIRGRIPPAQDLGQLRDALFLLSLSVGSPPTRAAF